MFETEQNQIIDSLKTPDAAKSWIVIGPHGVGKIQFAETLIQKLTQNKNEYNPSVKWITCGLTEAAKKEIQKALLAGDKPEEKEWAKKTEITVDDVREGCRFLSLKSDKIKILVLNLADEMNENAQNALLKTLEEPYPNTLILLLSENIGQLLPTILSRCQKVHLISTSSTETAHLLQTKYPTLSPQERDLLMDLTEGVLGLAEDFVRLNGLSLYTQMKKLISDPNNNGAELVAFAEQVSKEIELFNLFKYLCLKFLSETALKKTSVSLEKAADLSDLYQQVQEIFRSTKEQNLDKKQVVLSVIHKISEAL